MKLKGDDAKDREDSQEIAEDTDDLRNPQALDRRRLKDFTETQGRRRRRAWHGSNLVGVRPS
jgi:hypothetical protein